MTRSLFAVRGTLAAAVKPRAQSCSEVRDEVLETTTTDAVRWLQAYVVDLEKRIRALEAQL
jgi:hypothetical protein